MRKAKAVCAALPLKERFEQSNKMHNHRQYDRTPEKRALPRAHAQVPGTADKAASQLLCTGRSAAAAAAAAAKKEQQKE